jgi:hypothetical protein
MKKFTVCCLALALAFMFVPQSQAATYCIHLTNFCDTLNLTTLQVGGDQKTLIYGAWDWECVGDYTGSSIIGGPPGGTNTVATRPVYEGTPYAFAYSAAFTLKINGHTTDLYGTNATSAFAFQTAQPFTVNTGSCTGHANSNGKPRATR